MECYSARKRNEVHILPSPFTAHLEDGTSFSSFPSLHHHLQHGAVKHQVAADVCQHGPLAWNTTLTLQEGWPASAGLSWPQLQNGRGLQVTTGHSSGFVECCEGYAETRMRSLCSCHQSQAWLNHRTAAPTGSTTPAPFWAPFHQKICPSCPFSQYAEPHQGQSYPAHPSVMST